MSNSLTLQLLAWNKSKERPFRTECMPTHPWHVNESLMIRGWFTFSKGDRQGPARVVLQCHTASSALQGETSKLGDKPIHHLPPKKETSGINEANGQDLWQKLARKELWIKKVTKNCFLLFFPFKKQGWGTGGKDEGRKNKWPFYSFMAQSYLYPNQKEKSLWKLQFIPPHLEG